MMLYLIIMQGLIRSLQDPFEQKNRFEPWLPIRLLIFLFFMSKRQQNKFYCLTTTRIYQLCSLYLEINQFSYIHIQQVQAMKIVLKHKNELKLYTEDLDFDHILNFIQTQFKLSKQSLSMTFHDTQGDDITILTNEDFQIMQTILEGKEYVKINVEGTKIEMINQNEKMISVLKPQKVKQEPKEFQKLSKLLPTQSYIMEGSSENKEDQKESKSEIQSEQKCQQSNHKEKSCKFKYYLNEMVTNLVDERIKALLPCLKQQIKNSQESKPLSNNLMKHEGIQCKSCSVIPIVGIRYKCPKCPNFNLCEQCQNKIQHQHNLLKMKQIEPEEKVQQHPCMRQFFRGCPRREGGQQRQKCTRWFQHKLTGLSFIFGGEPEGYRSYVQQNQDLHPRQTFMAYAKSVGMPDQLFRKKFIQWRSQRLSLTFGKPAQNFYNFVEENYNLNYRQMVELLYQKGIYKREAVYPEAGRCYYNFKDFNKKKTLQVENQKEESKIEVTESILRQPKPLDSPEVNRAKGNLFMKIQNLFPEAQNKEIYKFVDETYSQTSEQEEVIKLWVEKCFGK